MKKKTVVKIVLDVLMIIVISLMYSKQALGLAFHEIGGLALIGVFFIHKGLNFTWIRRVTVKLKTADARTRLQWIVDAMMLFSFLLVGISGILMSKVAFPGLAVQGGPWKSIHYGCAALSLILVGVHLGLHFNYLKGIFSRWVRLPRIAAVALAAVIFAYGVYGIATTSFTRWLAMPFTASAEGSGEPRGGGQFPDATVAEDQSSSELAAASSDDEPSAQGSASSESDASQTSETEVAQTSARFPQGNGQDMDGGHGGDSAGVGGAIRTLAQFFSIAFAFAALTALLARLKAKARPRNSAAR